MKKGILIMLICTFFTAFGQFFQKKGTQMLSFNLLSLITNYYLILGLSLYVVGAFLLIYALKHGDLNVLYPIFSLTFIWVTILSAVFLGEPVTLSKVSGIALILCGVVFITGVKK